MWPILAAAFQIRDGWFFNPDLAVGLNRLAGPRFGFPPSHFGFCNLETEVFRGLSHRPADQPAPAVHEISARQTATFSHFPVARQE
eukprot:scaffold2036_cov256-Pinguiococcus_pyrenoidosus.AAC.21